MASSLPSPDPAASASGPAVVSGADGVTVRIADHVDRIRDNMDATVFSLRGDELKAKII